MKRFKKVLDINFKNDFNEKVGAVCRALIKSLVCLQMRKETQ